MAALFKNKRQSDQKDSNSKKKIKKTKEQKATTTRESIFEKVGVKLTKLENMSIDEYNQVILDTYTSPILISIATYLGTENVENKVFKKIKLEKFNIDAIAKFVDKNEKMVKKYLKQIELVLKLSNKIVVVVADMGGAKETCCLETDHIRLIIA